MNFLKTWLLGALTVFLTVVKKAIKIAKSEAIASAKTYTDNTATTTLQSAKSYTDQEIATLATSVGSITGGYKGVFPTKSAMDAVTAKAGDWAILSVDDGSNESGIYVRGTTNFSFVLDIAAFSEIRTEILASDAEFTTGTSTEKTATVKQIQDALVAITTKLDDYALKGGDDANKFLVADASVNTKEAVNASQFDFTFTEQEAQEAWDAINVDEPAYNFDVTADWAAKGVTDSASLLSKLSDNGSLNTTITDFVKDGNRIRCNVNGSYKLLLDISDIKALPAKCLDINFENGAANSTVLDLVATILLEYGDLVTWNSADLNPSAQPLAINRTAISDLCTANGGSAIFQ
jgi:hypothetical protein